MALRCSRVRVTGVWRAQSGPQVYELFLSSLQVGSVARAQTAAGLLVTSRFSPDIWLGGLSGRGPTLPAAIANTGKYERTRGRTCSGYRLVVDTNSS
jgi:hypothetical protein